MSSQNSPHIPVSKLWEHSRNLYPEVLTAEDWLHLFECEYCVNVLRSSYKAESMNQVEQISPVKDGSI